MSKKTRNESESLGKRICGTVLIDHPDVLKQSESYPVSVNYNSTKKPPEIFNGGEAWSNIITNTLLNEPYSGDWAYSSTQAVNLRVNICAFTNFYVSDFSKVDPMLYIDKAPRKGNYPSLLFKDQEESIFNGYSIYDALEFCFLKGFVSTNCFDYPKLKENGIDIKAIEKGSFEDKIKLIKTHTSTDIKKPKLLDRTHCLNKINDKYMARRIFRVIGIVNVSPIKDPLEKKILAIKREIYTSGPVVCGMLVYDNFITSTGIDIYTGPQENSKVIGGHSMVIMGWGKDPVLGDYWLINSCWNDFGELGITRIKCGIEKCFLEKNVVGFVPEIPNAVLYAANENITYSSPYFKIRVPLDNPLTFYSPDTKKLLDLGILVNEYGKSQVTPLIKSISNLPKLENYIAADIEYYYNPEKMTTVNKSNYFTHGNLVFMSVLIFIFFYWIFRKISK